MSNQTIPMRKIEGIETIASQTQKEVGQDSPFAENGEGLNVNYNQPTGSSSLRDESRSRGIEIEGLGSLDDIVTADTIEDEGEGDKVVVLHELVKGYVKGRVLRISRLMPTLWGRKGKLPAAQLEAKRLFDLGAIRLANKEEQNVDFVQLDEENFEQALERERRGRYQAEMALEKMKEQISSAAITSNAGTGEGAGRIKPGSQI